MTADVVHEPSAWIRNRMAERVAAVTAAGVDPHHGPTRIVAPLGSTGAPGSRADRECDRCGEHVPEGRLLHLVVVPVTPYLHLAGGLCTPCVAREGAWT